MGKLGYFVLGKATFNLKKRLKKIFTTQSE